MAGERRYTRIPPESTGDRVQLNVTLDVPYINKADLWISGALVTATSSGFKGRITRLREDTATTGVVSLRPEKESEDNNVTPTSGEDLQLGGVTIAQVGSADSIEIYTPAYKIVGWDGTHNGLNVDKQGSAQTRFEDGSPSLDAFGKLRVSGSRPIGDYIFNQDTLPNLFSTATTGAATLTWNDNTSSIVLTTTGAGGDSVTHTSDQYHHTIPGESQFVTMSVAFGDSGKTNLIRRWGYFDDNNGYFFQKEADGIRFVIRSSLTGSPVDTFIDQADWNIDNGTGVGGQANLTGLDLDTSLNNIYWIDFQDGDGRIRFGIFYEGTRLTLHQEFGTNQTPDLVAQSTRLPLRFSQTNTGTVGSTSIMKVFSAAVFVESDLRLSELGRPSTVNLDGTTSGGTETLIGALRPTQLLLNGKPNRNSYYPESSSFAAVDATDGTDGIARINVYIGGTITGGTWNPGSTYGTIEKNLTGTIGTPGVILTTFFVRGADTVDLSNLFSNSNNASIRNKADGTQPTFYYTATRLGGANDLNCWVSTMIKDLPN